MAQDTLAVRASLASSRRIAGKAPLGVKAEMEAVQRQLAATPDAASGRSFTERPEASVVGH